MSYFTATARGEFNGVAKNVSLWNFNMPLQKLKSTKII